MYKMAYDQLKEKYEQLKDESEKLKKIIFSYNTMFKAAMRANSLGLCKKAIKHALEDEQALNN